MFAAIIAAVSAVAALASSVIGGISAKRNADRSDRQLDLQEDSFEWQKNYDLNQTQIRVDDMAKAGLNPILASGSAGSSSVSAQSAQIPAQTQIDTSFFSKLPEFKLQRDQMKQDQAIAKENNETSKEVAKTNAESAKEVAEIQAETAKINAQLNAETQTSIATSNNEALAGVRGAQEKMYGSMTTKSDWQNAWNSYNGSYDGPASTPIQYFEQGQSKLASAVDNFINFVKDSVPADKVGDFKKWLKDKFGNLKGVDLSKVDWSD